MKRECLLVFLAPLVTAQRALADEPVVSAAPEVQAPAAAAPSSSPALEPRVNRPVPRFYVGLGYSREHVLGLEVDRLDVVAGTRIPIQSTPLILTVQGHVMPGRTHAGLTSYRTELSTGLSMGRGFRAALQAHVAYTMLLRATEKNAFTKALFGNAGAFGIGPNLELAAGPFQGWPKLFPAVRGGVDWFPGSGTAVWAGGYLGFEF